MSAEPAAHPRDPEAAEYVIGTLSLAEREAFEREMAGDAALVVLARSWEERLAPLTDHVPPVEPPASLWSALAAALAPAGPSSRASDREAGISSTVVPWPISPELVRLRRSRSLWRGATVLAGSLAAALALFIASDRLPPGEPKLVAVVNRSGELPALLVRVDRRAGTVQVRSLAAEAPAERSLELWSIVGGGAPRSLGLIAPGASRVAVPASDRDRLEGATLAVSVEPLGGSTTGGPTGPVVYSGKLFPETP